MGNVRTEMNCDWIAPYYRLLEHCTFGKKLEERRFAFLEQTATARKALVCGGGDGRFLEQLLRRNSQVRVDFVDLSPGMVELAKRRSASGKSVEKERVRFYVCDIREFTPVEASYDLIVTNFFLDCFGEAEIAGVVTKLAMLTSPHARWLVSEFRVGRRRLGRIWRQAIVRGLYLAFRVTTGLTVKRLPHYEAALRSAGFLCRCEERSMKGLLKSSLWGKCIVQN